MTESKTPDYYKSKTILNSYRVKTFRNQTLKDVQLSMLNSLSKGPTVDLSKIKKKRYLDNFDDYVSKMDISLGKYQLSYILTEKKEENDKMPNERYMEKDDTKLIKKVSDLNKSYHTKGLSATNE